MPSARGTDGEPATDRELMARHVAGDHEAFGEIFRRHRDRMWAVALRTLGNPDDAADAVQDATISAFRRADSYRGDAAVTTWLHRIVVNACLDRVRRETVRSADPLPEDDRSAHLATRRDEIAERDTRLDVTAALGTLPVEQRAALVLVDMAGFSVQDAADILEVAPGTIKSRCARGRARLLPLVRAEPTTPTVAEEPGRSGSRPGTGHQSGNQTERRGVGSGTPSAYPPSSPASAPARRPATGKGGDEH